jgi:diadenosine tetraphosphatase ApaH/serine/threonine PP2A family protein phosphatase
MKLALLSDVHANLQALRACLQHARLQGATQLAFLGDQVGYGGEPAAVLDVVMQLAAEGAWVIRGNHDTLAVLPPATATTLDEVSAQWTHQHLSADQRQYLQQLPLTRRDGNLLLVHASADAPQSWHYVDQPQRAALSLAAAGVDVRYVLGGHVHQQTLFYRGTGRHLIDFKPTPDKGVPVSARRQWLATVGSVGQPRDGRTDAMYTLFDRARQMMTFYRVPYDYQAAAKAIRATGLPEDFAQRLERGE